MSFRVVLDRLERLAADMDASAAAVDDVAHRRVAHEGLSDVRCVEDALREFFGCGTDGMAQLHGQVAGLASHLHDACSAYGTAEQEIIDAVRGTS
jgi:hypothetical protein